MGTMVVVITVVGTTAPAMVAGIMAINTIAQSRPLRATRLPYRLNRT